MVLRDHPPPLLHARPVVSHAFQDHRPLGNQELLPEVLQGRAAQPGHCPPGLQLWSGDAVAPGSLLKVRTQGTSSDGGQEPTPWQRLRWPQ